MTPDETRIENPGNRIQPNREAYIAVLRAILDNDKIASSNSSQSASCSKSEEECLEDVDQMDNIPDEKEGHGGRNYNQLFIRLNPQNIDEVNLDLMQQKQKLQVSKIFCLYFL